MVDGYLQYSIVPSLEKGHNFTVFFYFLILWLLDSPAFFLPNVHNQLIFAMNVFVARC